MLYIAQAQNLLISDTFDGSESCNEEGKQMATPPSVVSATKPHSLVTADAIGSSLWTEKAKQQQSNGPVR